jgi:hypothetical protein
MATIYLLETWRGLKTRRRGGPANNHATRDVIGLVRVAGCGPPARGRLGYSSVSPVRPCPRMRYVSV